MLHLKSHIFNNSKRNIRLIKLKYTNPIHFNMNDTTAKINTPRTAAIIVIGDEILKGQVQDTNSYFVSKSFFNMGVKLKRVCVVGDCEEDIIREVLFSSPKFTFVITTGGIGPTHDDITFSAVAKAFGERLIAHPVLVKICSEFFKTSDLNSPAMKLAHVPESAKLTFGFDKVRGRPSLYPNISVKNVFIFPGVPQLMERSFSAVSDELFGGGDTRFHVRELYLTDVETNIADHLNAVVRDHPHVVFGSYPKYDSYYKVRLTIEAQSEDDLVEAFEKLIRRLPSDIIVDYDKMPLENAYDKIRNLVEANQVDNYEKALKLVEDSCQKYRCDQICLYLGSDLKSTAILHLFYACLKSKDEHSKLRALFVSESNQTVNEYMKRAIEWYNIDVKVFTDKSPTSAIKSYMSFNTDIKLIVVGCSQAAKNWQDSSKPSTDLFDVMLIQPLAKWSDEEAWMFVRGLSLPYCSLHDQDKAKL